MSKSGLRKRRERTDVGLEQGGEGFDLHGAVEVEVERVAVLGSDREQHINVFVVAEDGKWG